MMTHCQKVSCVILHSISRKLYSSNKMSANISPPFTVVLLGKTGNGKSATGNTLLQVCRFEESNNATSETHSLINFSINPNDYPWRLKVFDTPGLIETEENNPYRNLTPFAENMNTLMNLCRKGEYGITAFLLVLNITNKYTEVDRIVIDAYRAIFGKEFLRKHCIIVFTFGDIFEEKLELWIKNQTGSLKQLLTTCENRVVLVSNKDDDQKRKDSRKRIISAIENLRSSYKENYGYDDYMKQEKDRYKTLLEHKLPELDVMYTEKILEIQQNKEKLSKEDRRNKIVILKNEIQTKDNGTGLLQKHIADLEIEYKRGCVIL